MGRWATRLRRSIQPASDRKRARGLVSLGHFLRHFFEMCVGFGVGDVLYLWAAGQLGYAAPFSQLPIGSGLAAWCPLGTFSGTSLRCASDSAWATCCIYGPLGNSATPLHSASFRSEAGSRLGVPWALSPALL